MWNPQAPAGTMAVPNTVTQPIQTQTRISGTPGIITGDGVDANAQNFRGLFNEGVQLQHSATTGEYKVNAGFPHITQGLPFLLQGRAKVYSMDVLMWTTESDPIRAIFGTQYTDVPVYILEERELIQAPAMVAPERVLARAPSIKYRSWTVRMRRIAIDLTVNTNGILEAEAIIREVDFKMAGNKNSIQEAILHCAYEAALKHGVSIDTALRESDMVYKYLSDSERIRRADAEFARNICGALHRPHGLTNLMMNVRKSNVYTPSGQARKPMEIALLPNLLGSVEATKPEKMTYSISGVTSDDQHESMELETVGYSNADWGNLRVLPYVPPPTSLHKINELTRVLTFGMYYIEKQGNAGLNFSTAEDNEDNAPCVITDFHNHTWTKLPRAAVPWSYDGTDLTLQHGLANADTSVYKARGTDAAKVPNFQYSETLIKDYWPIVKDLFPKADNDDADDKAKLLRLNKMHVTWIRPKFSIVGQSGLLCTEPGSATADILIAKPYTKLVEAGAVDEARFMTRLMVGTIVKKPQNLLILRDIKFAGIVSGAGKRLCYNEKYNKDKHDLILIFSENHPGSEEIWKEDLFISQCKAYGIYTAVTDPKTVKKVTEPVILYSGTVRGVDHRIRYRNTGHLGDTDHPDNVGVIEGNQAYIDIGEPFRGNR